jgi:hypothetical protein
MKRLKFGFRNLSDSKTLSICEQVHRNLAALPTEHLVQTQHEKLGSMVNDARGSHQRIALLRSQLKEELSHFRKLLADTRNQTINSANMAALNMNNDPVKMGTIGLSLHADKAPVGLPAAPDHVHAVPTDNEGEALLRWKRPLRECSFNVQMQLDPLRENGWKLLDDSLKQTCRVKDLKSGGKYWFRVRANNAHGQGPWSQPFSARVK